MSWLYSDFRSEVFDSLEEDPRFETYLDKACYRAIDEVFADSQFGNIRHEIVATVDKGEYALPTKTLFVNHVVFDGVPLQRITESEWLNGYGQMTENPITGTPYAFLVLNGQTLVLHPIPTQAKKIRIFLTEVTEDLALTEAMPFGRVYSIPAFHFARHWLLQFDGQDGRSDREKILATREMGKASQRLNGNRKEKVTRIV